MIVLALDSSADLLSVAVLEDSAVIAELTRRARRPAGEGLFPLVEAALDAAEMGIEEVALVAVATGPGSFNGIRGGIAVAEGLALARGIAAVGVPTLDALAFEQVGRAARIVALLPAGRGEFYGAAYAGAWHDWRRMSEYRVEKLESFLDECGVETLLCGRLDAETRMAAAARSIVCAPPFMGAQRAALVGALAAQRSLEPQFDAAASLRPLYLRHPGITRPNQPLSPVMAASGGAKGARPEDPIERLERRGAGG